jgi:hypothetical protein
MRILKSMATSFFALTTLLLITPSTQAHAKEPAYLHALSDLRSARGWIELDHRPEGRDARAHAVDEVQRAIDEVKHAAHDEGKETRFTPPAQSGGDPWAPLRSARRLLDEARHDVADGHDLPENQGLQDRALRHIDEAIHTLDRVIHH